MRLLMHGEISVYKFKFQCFFYTGIMNLVKVNGASYMDLTEKEGH